MSTSETPNLSLPYLAAAQAQKHITHNEALLRLDAILQLAVSSRQLSIPPANAPPGTRYLVPAGATGAWADAVGAIVVAEDGGWTPYAPRTGWCAWIADERRLAVFDGTAWRVTAFDPADGLDGLARLGVNASADAANRLAVRGAATLLDNEGRGHQLKINKSTAGDTASLLFQTGYEGRIEIGTAGDDQLRIKLADSSGTWTEALLLNGAGHVLPGQDNAQTLGNGARRWAGMYTTSGVVTASDARDKEVVAPLDGWAAPMVDAIAPVLYRRPNDPDAKVVHAGFLAQDVLAGMTATGRTVAVCGRDDPADPDSRLWIRADELLAVLWEAVRDARRRLALIEAQPRD